MGQLVGRVPKTWEDLMEERDRVLHWSSEVLARVDDNINNEDTFLMDYDTRKIDEKVHRWISDYRMRGYSSLREFVDQSADCGDRILRGLNKIANRVSRKMRKEYSWAYKDIRNFANRVDALGETQREIHRRIQQLEVGKYGVKRFGKKLAQLRYSVFENLETSEKIVFVERRLFEAFAKKVYDIDRKYKEECHHLVEVVLWKFRGDFQRKSSRT